MDPASLLHFLQLNCTPVNILLSNTNSDRLRPCISPLEEVGGSVLWQRAPVRGHWSGRCSRHCSRSSYRPAGYPPVAKKQPNDNSNKCVTLSKLWIDAWFNLHTPFETRSLPVYLHCEPEWEKTNTGAPGDNVPYQMTLVYQTAAGDFLCFLSPRLHPSGHGNENNRGSCCLVNWVQVRLCYSRGAGLSFLSYQEMPDLLQIRKTRMRLSIVLRLMELCSTNTDR